MPAKRLYLGGVVFLKSIQLHDELVAAFSIWRYRRQILLNYAGWKARKPSAKGEVFFLTFPFIRT
jgi:hypothetical protein